MQILTLGARIFYTSSRYKLGLDGIEIISKYIRTRCLTRVAVVSEKIRVVLLMILMTSITDTPETE